MKELNPGVVEINPSIVIGELVRRTEKTGI